MKRILGLAALLGHALSMSTGISVYGGARGGGKRSGPYYNSSTRPTDARWWHDSKDILQHPAILAALDKRQRKAKKLDSDIEQSWGRNYAHHNAFHRLNDATGFIEPLRLNPFYVAK